MIYLITGEPGDGKTNLAVTLVKERAEKEKRQVYCSGITITDPEALPWREVQAVDWFNCPVGSIVVIDECQATFEPRQRGKPQPDFARQLETHRHSGIDLYLITQHPTLIDSHDRKLVGTHYYTRRKFGSAWKTVFTFKGCADYPEKMRGNAIDERQTSDNKAAFAWYKSTELNTAKRAIPKKLWVLVFCIVAVPYLLYGVASRVMARQSEAKQSTPQAAPTTAAPGLLTKSKGTDTAVQTPAEYAALYTPRIPGLEYTAPAFDGITAPVVAPYPAACLSIGPRCACYTQQGTVLDVPESLCLSIVKRGFFVSWQPPTPAPLPPAVSTQDRIGGMGGTPSIKTAALPAQSFVAADPRSLADAFPGGVPARRSLVNGRSAPALSSAASAGAGEAGP